MLQLSARRPGALATGDAPLWKCRTIERRRDDRARCRGHRAGRACRLLGPARLERPVFLAAVLGAAAGLREGVSSRKRVHAPDGGERAKRSAGLRFARSAGSHSQRRERAARRGVDFDDIAADRFLPRVQTAAGESRSRHPAGRGRERTGHVRSLAGKTADASCATPAVVRSLSNVGRLDPKRPGEYSATAQLNLRPDWNRANLKLVLFVQDRTTRRILGAASVKP